MITKIFVLCVAVTQVSSNPLLQALVRNCPICQQNALKNPLASALPMLFQQPPLNQPFPQELISETPCQAPIGPPMPCPMCPPQNPTCGPCPPPNPNCGLLNPMCSPQNPMCSPQNPTCGPQNPMYCPQNSRCGPQNPMCFPQNPMCGPQNSMFPPQCPSCPCPPNKCHPQSSCPSQNAPNFNNEINQAFINKLMSNPAVKSILDPNTKLINEHGSEVPKDGPYRNGQPNVINNYIIVPKEILLEDIASDQKEHRKSKEERRSGDGKTRRRKPKQEGATIESTQHVENKSEKEKSVEKSQINNIENETEQPRQRKRRRRKKNRNPNIKVQVVDENETNTESEILPLRVTENPDNNSVLTTTTEASLFEPTTTEQNMENFKDTSVTVSDSGANTSEKLDETTTPKETTEITTRKIKPTSEVEIKIHSSQQTITEPPTRNKDYTKNSTNRNKDILRNNSREESIIAEFRRKFPNIPEDVVRDLINHMAWKIQSQNLEIPSYYFQHNMNYEKPFKNQFKQNMRSNNERRRNKQIKGTKDASTTAPEIVESLESSIGVSKKISQKPITIDVTTKSVSLLKETTITPKIVTVTVKPVEIMPGTTKSIREFNSDVDMYETCDGEITKPTQLDTKHVYREEKSPELGTEDIVPIVYVNGLDEYYPDFTGDNQYFSDEDYSYFRPEEDRYYYTTDKNVALGELNRGRRKHDDNFDQHSTNPEKKLVFRMKPNNRERPNRKPLRRRRPISRDVITTTVPKTLKSTTETPKVILTIQQSTEKAKEIVESQFKIPPTLENIDFETKPVNKNYYFKDNDYKISTYSDFKTPQYNINDKSAGNVLQQKAEDKIETVYARSKVVKYGQPHFENESNLFSTEDKTVIMARSVPDDFW